MVEQAGFLVKQVLDMHQHLMDRLVDPVLPVILLPHLIEEKHGHKQGVDPHLIFIQPDSLAVAVGAGDVLEPALLRPWQAAHQPVGPF